MQVYNKKIIRYLIPVFLLVFCFGYAGINVFGQGHGEGSVTDTTVKASSSEIAAVEGDIGTVEAKHSEKAEEKLNAGKLIMEHIADAYEWHVVTIGHKHITIPLLIILKDNSGIRTFLSSRFEHGHAVYQGYKLDKGKIVAVNSDGSANKEASFINISISKNVLSMLLAVTFLMWIMLSVARKYSTHKDKAPKGLANIIEVLIIFIRDEVAKPSIGKKYAKFLPYLLTIFFFIFINNLFGLIPFFPGGANVTGNIAVTLVLAVFTFAIMVYNGNKGFWKHIVLPPGVPLWLLPMMIPIEIIGLLNKPIVLMVRLFANITAGHIIILGFLSLIFIFAEINMGLGYGVSIISVAFSTFMYFLELLVAFLQAYVFTLLASLYFGSAVEEHHHEEIH